MTTYTVTAERASDNRTWVLQCVEHPGAISQTTRLVDADALMREAIAWTAGVTPDSVEIQLRVLADGGARDGSKNS